MAKKLVKAKRKIWIPLSDFSSHIKEKYLKIYERLPYLREKITLNLSKLNLPEKHFLEVAINSLSEQCAWVLSEDKNKFLREISEITNEEIIEKFQSLNHLSAFRNFSNLCHFNLEEKTLFEYILEEYEQETRLAFEEKFGGGIGLSIIFYQITD